MRRDELISSMGNDSYQELLDEIDDDTPCQNGEFIEINKFMLIQARLDEQDYRYFWGCMKLYDYCKESSKRYQFSPQSIPAFAMPYALFATKYTSR